MVEVYSKRRARASAGSSWPSALAPLDARTQAKGSHIEKMGRTQAKAVETPGSTGIATCGLATAVGWLAARKGGCVSRRVLFPAVFWGQHL